MAQKKLHEKLNALVIATEKKMPKETNLTAIERLVADAPELWRGVDLSHTTALQAMKAVSKDKDDLSLMEINYESIKNEFGYQYANPLERVLIKHIALCWMRLQFVEQKYSNIMEQSISLQLGDYWERRLSSTQKRYLKALETFARIKRLRLPAMQVNIADKQVNVAGD